MSDNITPEQLAATISKAVVKALKPKIKKAKQTQSGTSSGAALTQHVMMEHKHDASAIPTKWTAQGPGGAVGAAKRAWAQQNP